MVNPYQNELTPIQFNCEKCGDAYAYWAVPSDKIFQEPSRYIRGKEENRITTAQCSLCKEINTIYWYKTKLSN